MPIVASSFVLGPAPEIDGRRYVTETHVDQYGLARDIEYLAEAGADYDAIMTARAAVLSQQLIDAEIAMVLNGP